MTDIPLGNTFTPSAEAWVDMALGRFVRAMPLLETLLFFTASAATGKTILHYSRKGATEAVDDIEGKLVTFPQGDRISLGKAMVDARHVLKVRHNLVHGMWSEVPGKPMTFVSELPIRSRPQARELLERDHVTDDELPSLRLTFNRDLILEMREKATNVSQWLNECLDVWEAHFGVTYDD